ncbi:hypothetical protein [Tellurirhabdus bombi]|uniref:hypothetical protein n=1 Tax=Tellurirhabdus bombi TaxID=2907205 RepID=UPI001F197480|nr:hypothetical protein [Tellurirhabdus bombi]
MAHQAIFEPELAPLFIDKAPIQFSTPVKHSIVKYGPYVLAILLPFCLLALILSGNMATLRLFTLHLETNISLLVLLLSLCLGITAIPGLFRRTRSSWTKLYWAELIYCLSAIIEMDFGGLLLTFSVGFYILFQIRSYFHS